MLFRSAIFVPTLFMPDLTHLSYMTKNLLWIAFGTVVCLGMARPSYSLWLAVDYWIAPWNSEPPKKNDDTIELPLVSLVIRTDSDEPRQGTRNRWEN